MRMTFDAEIWIQDVAFEATRLLANLLPEGHEPIAAMAFRRDADLSFVSTNPDSGVSVRVSLDFRQSERFRLSFEVLRGRLHGSGHILGVDLELQDGDQFLPLDDMRQRFLLPAITQIANRLQPAPERCLG